MVIRKDREPEAGGYLEAMAGGGSWSRTSRPRIDKHPTQMKLRWEVAV